MSYKLNKQRMFSKPRLFMLFPEKKVKIKEKKRDAHLYISLEFCLGLFSKFVCVLSDEKFFISGDNEKLES